MRDELYIQQSQQRTIENTLAYLYDQKKHELATPILDLMRMSENWYGRLDELRSVQKVHRGPEASLPSSGKGGSQ
jgi:hypothetical protein